MKIGRRLGTAITLLFVWGMTNACGGSPSSAPSTDLPPTTAPPAAKPTGTVSAAAEPVNVEIKLFAYNPEVLEVPVGTTVSWTNRDGIEHSVTNGTPQDPSETFDSGLFTQGESFSFAFTETGEYPYFCTRHNSLQGLVKVVPAP